MDIIENISDSVVYPISEIKNLAIFIVLLLSCLLIVTIPLVTGYFYRIIKESAEGSDILPEFDDLGQMYIDGLKYLAVGLIYGIVVGIVFVILITLASLTGSGAITALMTVISIVLVCLVILFSAPASFNMIINDGDFGAAFDFGTIFAIIGNIGVGQYVIWIIAVAIIGIIGNIISSLFSWTLIIPLIISAWLYCFEARSIALLFAYE